MATQVSLLSGAVASAGSLLLQTNGTTTQATLDTSGNLGLGVTPNGSLSGYKIFEIGSAGNQLFSAANDLFLSTNAYYSSGWKYGTSNYASQYEQTAGKHQWFTAASGTAGNAITFTQAMTLDASGNLLVGTTTSNSRMSVWGTNTNDGASYYTANILNTATAEIGRAHV